MTVTTQTGRESSLQADDEVGLIVEGIQGTLPSEELKQLLPRLSEFENSARNLFSAVPKSHYGKRAPFTIAVAAVYHVLLQNRGSTGVRVSMDQLALVSGLSRNVIGGAWAKFFDRSVDLRRDRLDMILVDDAMDISDLIHEAIIHLQKGVEEPTPEVMGWFNRVEAVAHQLMRDVKLPEKVHPEVAALSAIYEASYRIDGPRLVNITFGDAMEVCGYGEGLVSRTKNKLFPEGGGY